MGNTGVADGALILHNHDYIALLFGVSVFPVLERAPCKGVMRKACRVSDAWREKMVIARPDAMGTVLKILVYFLLRPTQVAVYRFTKDRTCASRRKACVT